LEKFGLKTISIGFLTSSFRREANIAQLLNSSPNAPMALLPIVPLLKKTVLMPAAEISLPLGHLYHFVVFSFHTQTLPL
jgi:hypothetical protein